MSIIPVPEGLQYLPFQVDGIEFLRSHRHAILGDEMGVGKTIQALGLINAEPDIKSILIICPASLKFNWLREAQRWLVRPARIEVSNGKFSEAADIAITNYDNLKKFGLQLRAREWDLMICDEAHYLKNPKAQRTQAVVGGRETPAIKAKRHVFLTGTPILNRPVELWPILKFLGVFDNWYLFVRRYCNASQGRFGWDVSGASHTDELGRKLYDTCMLRRLAREVLPQLPAARRTIVELKPEGAAIAAVRRENAASAESDALLSKLRADVKAMVEGADKALYHAKVTLLQDATQAAFAQIGALRHATAIVKVPQVVAYVSDFLEGSDQKVIVFAHHHDVIAQIAEGLAGYGVVTLTGETPLAQRQANVDSFQSADGPRVFVGGIQASGVGLTLTAASRVIFAELDWVPANLDQAEARAVRIGQTRSVLIEHLVFDGSLDARLAKTVVSKQRVIDAVLKPETVPEVVPEPEPETVPEVVPEPEPVGVPGRYIDRVAQVLSTDERDRIHGWLRALAESDTDYAGSLNGVGFNRLDTEIGHSLADAPTLSPKQAALGLKILRKYDRQLQEEPRKLVREVETRLETS